MAASRIPRLSNDISTHAPRTGGDKCLLRPKLWAELFQPTPPAQGATAVFVPVIFILRISTHAPRTGGDVEKYLDLPEVKISTHAPRTGGDRTRLHRFRYPSGDFNPRPPHRGRRDDDFGAAAVRNFNPRPPHRGRHGCARQHSAAGQISTHAPRTGGDSFLPPGGQRKRYFNPRPPHRGRPILFLGLRSLLAGFQPTPPAQGATTGLSSPSTRFTAFQPTPPAQGATTYSIDKLVLDFISTHAPRTGGDSKNNQNKTPDFP